MNEKLNGKELRDYMVSLTAVVLASVALGVVLTLLVQGFMGQ